MPWIKADIITFNMYPESINVKGSACDIGIKAHKNAISDSTIVKNV